MSRRYRTGPYNNPSRRRGRFLTGVRPLNYGSVARNERSTSYDGHSTGSASFSGRSRDRAGGGRDTRGPEAEVHPQDYLNLVSPDLLSCILHSSSVSSRSCRTAHNLIPVDYTRLPLDATVNMWRYRGVHVFISTAITVR